MSISREIITLKPPVECALGKEHLGRCPEFRRFSVYEIDDLDDLDSGLPELYSRMKYGDPLAVREVAERMAAGFLLNINFDEVLRSTRKPVIITSSAYGEVPTAAHAVSIQLVRILRENGVPVDTVKIDRNGDFGTSDYGTMSLEERKRRMGQRKIVLSKEAREKLKDAFAIVVDDVHVTGSHEKTLKELLETCEAKECVFSYLVEFSPNLAQREPQTEEKLNRAIVKTVTDLAPFFVEPIDPNLELRINARTIKFIMTTTPESELDDEQVEKVKKLSLFLSALDEPVLQKVYASAMSADGYWQNSKYELGFRAIEREMIRRGLQSVESANRRENKISAYNATIDGQGNLVDMETGENLNWLGKKYSLMKFGSVNEIQEFAGIIADKFIQDLSEEGSALNEFFNNVKNRAEYVMLVAPGFRNVESSSNYLFEEVVSQINIELALRDLPTVILAKLSRLESNTANYATLSEEERKSRPDSTKTLLPGPELYRHPIHLIFADDIRITGATADRVKESATENGALSYSSIYALSIDPVLAAIDPSVEDYLNKFAVTDRLDEAVEYILNQDGFRPVQRLIRLILGPSNREGLGRFLENIRDESLIRLYVGSLCNDYMKSDKYKQSIEIIQTVMRAKGLVDDNGRLIKRLR
jgi:hypothetical protein